MRAGRALARKCHPKLTPIILWAILYRHLHILELTPAEKRLLIRAMLCFSNELRTTGRPTEDVNEILLKII